jgi:hypothetical protein
MLVKVIEAVYIKDYSIQFTFNTSEKKIIDLKDQLWGEIFEPLNNQDVFRTYKLNDFTIEWPNGADFSPEFLYELGQVQ